MEYLDKKKLGVFFISTSFVIGLFLIFNTSIFTPTNELHITAPTLYRNITILLLLNWLFILGIVLIKKEWIKWLYNLWGHYRIKINSSIRFFINDFSQFHTLCVQDKKIWNKIGFLLSQISFYKLISPY